MKNIGCASNKKYADKNKKFALEWCTRNLFSILGYIFPYEKRIPVFVSPYPTIHQNTLSQILGYFTDIGDDGSRYWEQDYIVTRTITERREDWQWETLYLSVSQISRQLWVDYAQKWFNFIFYSFLYFYPTTFWLWTG